MNFPLQEGAVATAKADAAKSSTKQKMETNDVGVSVGKIREQCLTTEPTERSGGIC